MYMLMTQRLVSLTHLPSELQARDTTRTWLLLVHLSLNIAESKFIFLSRKPTLHLMFSTSPPPLLPVVHARNVDVALDYCLFFERLSMLPYR